MVAATVEQELAARVSGVPTELVGPLARVDEAMIAIGLHDWCARMAVKAYREGRERDARRYIERARGRREWVGK